MMAAPTSWTSLKVLLMSTCVLFIAMAMKFYVPLVIEFMIYQVPSIWSFMASWLRPPYLYLVINCIIICIAASSCFHHKDGYQNCQIETDSSDSVLKSPPLVELQTVFQLEDSRPDFRFDSAQLETALIDDDDNNNNTVVESLEIEEEFVISRSNWTPLLRADSPEIQTLELEMLPTPERPMALSRFSHRKPVKTSPEGGRRLRVAKPRKQETLENTWKMITDGRHMPLTSRHYKKSDLRENHGLQCAANLAVDESPKTSETVTEGTSNCNSPSPSTSTRTSGRIRKEPSLSHDDLNRRVEAFIKKFNEDMRLERQESLRKYKEMMIDREARGGR